MLVQTTPSALALGGHVPPVRVPLLARPPLGTPLRAVDNGQLPRGSITDGTAAGRLTLEGRIYILVGLSGASRTPMAR